MEILEHYNYKLPPHLIAHTPSNPRDHSKLLVFDRSNNTISHQHFYDLIDLLTPNDILVFNDTKVFPARLYATKKETNTPAEVLLIKHLTSDTYLAIGRPNLKPNQELIFSPSLNAKVINKNQDGTITIQFNQSNQELFDSINQIGNTPLPPYISSKLTEKQARLRYQTIYAKHQGSAAAPTAGLHFTEKLLAKLKEKGIQYTFVTLHVGLGTFQNLRPEQLEKNELHQEEFSISSETAAFLNQSKKSGKRIIAIGTTTTRVLESAAKNNQLIPQQSSTKIFIRPPYQFKFVDGLITNFHLPKSSLLMLIAAFTTKPNTKSEFSDFTTSPIGQAYQDAVDHQYRFFSFGDAMYIK